MHQVSLEGLEFMARHGYYAEERIISKKFGVDITVDTDFSLAADTDQLVGTVNYEALYQIIRAEMEQSYQLLEHLANKICDQVLEQFPTASQVQLTVRKFHPPIGGICHAATIRLQKARNETLR